MQYLKKNNRDAIYLDAKLFSISIFHCGIKHDELNFKWGSRIGYRKFNYNIKNFKIDGFEVESITGINGLNDKN